MELIRKIAKSFPPIKKIIDQRNELLVENRRLKSQIIIEKVSICESQNKTGPIVLVSRPIAFTFPLSYAYLAGYLKSKGEDVVILFRTKDNKDLVRQIIDLNPLMVGFGNLYPELQDIGEIIDQLNIAERNFPVVVGGQMVSPTPEFAVKITGADYGVIGEGEIVLYKLVRALREGIDPKSIGGMAIRKGSDTFLTGPGEYIEDISELPPIPYELFPEEEWLWIGKWYVKNRPEVSNWKFKDKVINVHGGRGCPFACNFCYHHNKARYRSIEDMMTEAAGALKRFDANFLYFSDDLVIATPKRARQLIDCINKLDRKIEFSISTRFDILERLDDKILADLKSAGCRTMGLGIESGSNRMLEIIGKNTTAEKIIEGLKRISKNKILPTVSIMVGQYTETIEDVEDSIRLMVKSIRINPNINYAFTVTTPFPGSELYNIIFREGLLKDDLEFYSRYFDDYMKIGDWGQIVNLSKMSDQEVVEMHAKIVEIYKKEKLAAFGDKAKKIVALEKKINRLANIEKDVYMLLGLMKLGYFIKPMMKIIERKYLKLDNKKNKLRWI